MPLHWAIDHATRTVVATGNDVLSVAEIRDCLDGMSRSATLSYRKLLNLSRCSLALTDDDLIVLARQFNVLGTSDTMGSAAVVVGPDEAYRQTSMFEGLTGSRRPVKVFREIQAAHEWLAAQPLQGSHPYLERLDDETTLEVASKAAPRT